MNIISLGAGVQSTTMLRMAARGEIEPMPDAAIFSDTRREPKAVYEHLALLQSSELPFPIHIVSAGDLKENVLRAVGGERWASLPVFTKAPEAFVEKRGQLRRQCTRDFKLNPLKRKMRELAGRPKGRIKAGAVTAWIGISTDEKVRATPSDVKWQVKRFPLIEKGMSRHDCIRWLERRGYPIPPKSSCTFCPYHSDAEWRRLRDSDPSAWAEALEVDRSLRNMAGARGMRQPCFLHSSCQPLDEVDLSMAEDRGQLNLFALNDCVGMCGT